MSYTTTTTSETTALLRKGEYRAPTPTDLRSPCPIVNALANHGHISRSGRNIRAADLQSAMSTLGISYPLRHLLTSVAYLEHHDPPTSQQSTTAAAFWAFITNPFAYIFRSFALRSPGQVDASGEPCLNLDELDRHNAVEHDVSMSRRDFAQGDNHTSNPDLVASMLSSAQDGKDITVSDWARFRVQRITEQTRDNPSLDFGKVQNTMGFAEMTLIQKTFGDGARGWNVPVSYMAALFGEERLPVVEGWKKRRWWSVGIIELTTAAQAFGKIVEGVKIKAS